MKPQPAANVGAGCGSAQRMAQLRYKSYVRKTQEDWSAE